MTILLIGLGRWGEKHLRVLRELGEDVWVADVSAGRRAWATQQGLLPRRVVSDYREALAEVDGVDVVTPADSHRTIVGACLAAGRPCFVEKPLSVTSTEGRALADAAHASGKILQVGHIFRFHPVTAALRVALRDGRIGSVRYITGRFAGFKRPRADVGVTHTDAIHYVDLFAYLLERHPTGVMALQRDYLGRGLDDMSVMVVHYGDVPAAIEANYFATGPQRECVIVGETGSLVADFGAGTATLHAQAFEKRGAMWEAVDRGKETLPVGAGEPLRLELAAFLTACAGRGPNLVPVEAGVRAVAVVEAAARSSELGRVVSLDELA